MDMGIAVNSNYMNTIQNQSLEREKKSSAEMKYAVGDIVSGTVTKVSDQISIQFSEKETSISKNTIPDAKEGDVLNFRVVSMSSDGKASLQYLPKETSSGAMKSIMCTAVLKDSKAMAAQNAAVSAAAEEESLREIEQSMTKEDCEDLSEEGFSLEDYELERFEQALERIKQQRAMVEDAINHKVESVKKQEEDVKKASLSKLDDPALRRQAEVMLQAMNLPVSAVNVNAVAGAVKLAVQSVNMDERSIHYLLKNHLESTPVNVYTANYSAKDIDITAGEQEWNEVKKQAEMLVDGMKDDGISATLDEAKWLFQHGLSIDADTMGEYQNLKNLRDNFSVEDTMKNIVKGMAEGRDPIHTVLADKNYTMVQNIVENFSKVSDDAVNKVVQNGGQLNLRNLKQAQSETNQGQANRESNVVTDQVHKLEHELSLITARRQLEEIRLKLTCDAGIKLVEKGLNLQTDSIETIVNELRGLEKQYYEKLLTEGGAEITAANTAQLRSTLEAVSSISQAPEYVLGVHFKQRNSITVGMLAEDALTVKSQLKKANDGYEKLMTAPRGDMGDHISKAFAQMDTLLDEIGLGHSEADKRAVRILAYNQMEITKTSVEQMKAYDQKVRGLIDALKPSTVVELIKNKTNPLDTPVEELKNQVQQIAREHGISDEEKYSNYLVKIQKSNTLSQDERDAYVGIYRLLHQVEKSDGKAIGYLVKSQRDLTLNNLLSAIRTTNGAGINAAINDQFGTSEGAGYKQSISEQLGRVFTSELEQARTELNVQLSNQLLDQLTPDFLQYAGQREELMNCSIERLAELCEQYKVQNPQAAGQDYEMVMTQIKQAMNLTDEMRFLKEHQAKVSLKNIQSAEKTLHNCSQMMEQMESACSEEDKTEVNSVLETSETYDQFHIEYENIVNLMTERLREQLNHPTLSIEDMLMLNDSLRQSSYVKELAQKEYYHIPVEVGGKVVGVGLSIQSNSSEKGKMSIHMDSETFGEVQADFRMSGDELKALILCGNKPAAQLLERAADAIKQEAYKSVNKVQVHVGTSDRMIEQYDGDGYVPKTKGVQTESLFQIAKVLIKTIKEIDN